MKFEFNWPSGSEEKMFENVDGRTDDRRPDDGRRSDWYTFRSQTCLNVKKGSDWPKRWVEAQHNILKL